QGCQVSAVDISATAVAASGATLERNGLQGRVEGGDLYGRRRPAVGQPGVGQGERAPEGGDWHREKPHRFQAIITNPPFHDGRLRTTDTTRRLIEGAPARLRDDGVLWMVANRELPYAQWLSQGF